MSRKVLRPAIAAVVGCLLALSAARADEGMWLFNALPKKQLKER